MNRERQLLITLSNIGDAVMTTAVLEALHACAPDALIDVVGDRRSSVLFAACPYVDRVLHKDKRGLLRGLPQLVAELRRTRYDLVVDLRTGFLPLLLRARRRAWRRRRARGPHAVQQHLSAVTHLCPAASAAMPRLWPRAADVERAHAALGPWRGRRLLALGPGANWALKIWPTSGFLELVAGVRAEFDAVVLLGNDSDRIPARVIAAGASLPCVDLAGHTGLLEAAAVLACCRAFVGNDSGLGHMAAAMGVPTLTLFGPGDPARYHPWGDRAAWLVEPGRDLARLPAAVVVAALAALLRGEKITGTAPGGT